MDVEILPMDVEIPIDEETPIEKSALDIAFLETLFNKLLGPIKAEIGNIHDRMDNIQYPQNSARLQKNQQKVAHFNEQEYPPLTETTRSRPFIRPNYRNADNSVVKQVQSNNRDKSASKKRDANRDKSATSRFSNKTFAEMVNNSKIKPNFIRNIKINAEGTEELNRISAHLSSNYACQDVGIKTINSKSKDFLTIKCKSEEDAKKLENTLKTKYGTKIEISNVRDSDPKFKIVGVSLENQSPSQFILNLQEQNDWLKNASITYVEHFGVPSRFGSYTNIILTCVVPTLRRVLEKGSVICGLDMKKVYEHMTSYSASIAKNMDT